MIQKRTPVSTPGVSVPGNTPVLQQSACGFCSHARWAPIYPGGTQLARCGNPQLAFRYVEPNETGCSHFEPRPPILAVLSAGHEHLEKAASGDSAGRKVHRATRILEHLLVIGVMAALSYEKIIYILWGGSTRT